MAIYFESTISFTMPGTEDNIDVLLSANNATNATADSFDFTMKEAQTLTPVSIDKRSHSKTPRLSNCLKKGFTSAVGKYNDRHDNNSECNHWYSCFARKYTVVTKLNSDSMQMPEQDRP